MTGKLTLAMTGETDITFTRRFDAARPLVWRAMTEPALITRWLWARDAPMTTCEQDFRVGGTLRWVWRMANGRDMGLSGRYLDIAAPVRVVHTEIFDEDWTGGETTVDLALAAIAPEATEMRMVVRYASTEARARAAATPMADGMEEGYARLDGLLTSLPGDARTPDFRIRAEGDLRLIVTRSFAAPLAQVRRAHLDPALLRIWMASEDYPIRDIQLDARDGGRFRYEWAAPDGTPLILSGTFEEIGPTRIVHSETFTPDWTGGATRVVTTFATAGPRTVVTVEVSYSSPEARDAVAASGMAAGMAGSYDRLDRLVEDATAPAG